MAVAETDKSSLISPSSSTLDFHLSELEEECARFVALVNALLEISPLVEPAGPGVIYLGIDRAW